jgi:prepilin signal peptidase PulO-like enzyme (type II secretory pathway)
MSAPSAETLPLSNPEPQRPGPGDARPHEPLVPHRTATATVAAGAAILAFVVYPLGVRAAIAAFLAAVLVVLGTIDLTWRIIPNRLVVPSLLLVLIARLAFFPDRALEFMLATVGAGLVFLIPNVINSSMMGIGDVKLAMLLGAGLGRGVIGAVITAFFASFPYAVAVLIRGGRAARKRTLPFGPFLALGGLVILVLPRLA